MEIDEEIDFDDSPEEKMKRNVEIEAKFSRGLGKLEEVPEGSISKPDYGGPDSGEKGAIADLLHKNEAKDAESSKNKIVEKMRLQNSKLKTEFITLKEKLQECLLKVKEKKKVKQTEKVERTEEEILREQEMKETEQKIQYYKKQIQIMKAQLEGSLNIERIVAMENEIKSKKKIIEELEGEKQSLLRIQKDQRRNNEGVANERDLKKKRDQMKEELRSRKNEFKEKQGIVRKQEKQMKDQHENLIKLEEHCRKMQSLINEKKAGIASNSNEVKTQGDIESLQREIREAEREYAADKKKYKQSISEHENKIKDLTMHLERLSLELKQKDQECRINALKINELKRQIRLNAQKPLNDSGPIKDLRQIREPRIMINVEQLKRDMEAESSHSNAKPQRVPPLAEDLEKLNRMNEKNSDSLRADSAIIPKTHPIEEPVKKPDVIPLPQPDKSKAVPSNVFSKPNIGLHKKKR